jgi:hypothetical protein
MTPATAANERDSRLRGIRVSAVVIDAPLSAHGCVRLATKLPAARGPATHATSRGLVRSCRPRRRNRAVSHRAASPPRATLTTAGMACHGSIRSTAEACPSSPRRATTSILLPVPRLQLVSVIIRLVPAAARPDSVGIRPVAITLAPT